MRACAAFGERRKKKEDKKKKRVWLTRPRAARAGASKLSLDRCVRAARAHTCPHPWCTPHLLKKNCRAEKKKPPHQKSDPFISSLDELQSLNGHFLEGVRWVAAKREIIFI